MGSQMYTLLKNLVSPTLPKDELYEDLVDALTKHYEPKQLEIAKRFHFHWQSQAVGESINEYMADLQYLSTNANLESS